MKLTERHEKAVAINLDGRKVLIFDASGYTIQDVPGQGEIVNYPARKTSKARTSWGSTTRPEMYHNCYLGRVTSTRPVDQKNGCGDYFYLGTTGTMLSNDESPEKYIEFAEYASSPIIAEGDRCAILVVDMAARTTEVHTVKAGPIHSGNCIFLDETREETMPSIQNQLGWMHRRPGCRA